MNEFAYTGTKPCGCTVGAVVIDEKWAKDTAKVVAGWIKDGYSVGKVSLADGPVRVKRCTCVEESDARWEKHKQTLSFF